MRLFVLCLFLGAVAAEAPFAGYPASGWRPQGPQFRLPTEYGAPLVQQKVEVEITKEKVAHAAQVVETTTEEFLSNEYLPPTTTDQPELDPIRVQGLPDNQFRDFQQKPKDTVSQQQQPVFPLSGQLRAQQANNFQFGRQEQDRPTQTYGVPDQDEQDSGDQDLPENQYQGFQQNSRVNPTPQQSKQQQPILPQNGQLRAQSVNNFQFGRQEQVKPAQAYGVPAQDEQYTSDQDLPENQFQGFQQNSRVIPAPQQSQQKQPIFPQNGQLRAQPTNNFQFGRQEQVKPAQTYGVPDQDDNDSGDQDFPENQYQGFQQTSRVNPAPQQPQQQPFFPLSGQLRALPANNFQFSRQEQAQPTQLYGAPDKDDNGSGDHVLPEEPEPTNVPDSDSNDDETHREQIPNGGRPVIAVANSLSGQYYVVGPDSTLQRVMYATSQSDDDRRNMGFTAQLRYSQIEPIRGPVYAYNEQGQLVRIYK